LIDRIRFDVNISAPKEFGSSVGLPEALVVGKSYRFLGTLGRGAVGEVYVVAHTVLKRRFALKVVHARYADDTHFIDRMRVEAQATARLHHKNIVEVVDFWIAADGRPCIVMELLEGSTVAQEVTRNGPVPAKVAVTYTAQLLSALTAAHTLGVVHRDVKPENLFLHQGPGRPRILKVLDFGFARVLPQASERAPRPPAQATETGAIMGTPRFASPEALQGAKVDHRSDLFSAGAVLYFMLTGRGPYDRMMTMDPDAYDLAPPSAVVGSGVSAELDAVVLRATQWSLSERYQTAEEFAADLSQLREARPTLAP